MFPRCVSSLLLVWRLLAPLSRWWIAAAWLDAVQTLLVPDESLLSRPGSEALVTAASGTSRHATGVSGLHDPQLPRSLLPFSLPSCSQLAIQELLHNFFMFVFPIF